jgi:hypothetical protein
VVLSPRGHFGDLQSLASTDRIYRRDLTMRAIANNPKWIANFPYRAYSFALNCRGMKAVGRGNPIDAVLTRPLIESGVHACRRKAARIGEAEFVTTG